MIIDLAIIPARAGSQDLPGKNIAKLGGEPLIAWTIKAAINSGIFNRVIVTTDCGEISAHAKAAGAEVPFTRPSHLATSTARSIDVVLHALDATETKGSFALLQPTSPFRNALHIVNAAKLYQSQAAQSLISVVQGKPLQWQFSRSKDNRLIKKDSLSESIYRRQDAEPQYSPNGAIYICTVEGFLASETLFLPDTLAYEMSVIDSIDIDTHDDMELAQAIVDQRLRVIDK